MSEIFSHHSDTPEFRQATAKARETFKYFWRELTWEQRRIIPGLDVSAVKIGFADQGEGGFFSKLLGRARPADPDRREFMWVGEVGFDGYTITGKLLNAPSSIGGYVQGQRITVDFEEVVDWLYAMGGVAYGGFSIDLMRSEMAMAELRSHDSAWALDFGPPGTLRLTPFDEDDAEHPMSANMAGALEEAIQEDPSLVEGSDDRGNTLLHDMALGGSFTAVDLLLAHGARPDAARRDGATPVALAKKMGWGQVVSRLERATQESPSGG